MRRVTLRHQQLEMPQQLVHFYDGYIVAKDGVVDAVLSDVQIEALWRRGFNRTLDGRVLEDSPQLFAEIDRQNS